MKRFYLFLVLTALSFGTLVADDNNTYASKMRLFYVERSKNKNLVCYDVNLDEAGVLNASSPVTVYWINREERPGERNGLSLFQKRMAFGYKTLSHETNSVQIAINACSNRPIRLEKQGGYYACITKVDNQEAILESIYVKTKPSNSLSVEYVELRGRNLKGEPVSERIAAGEE